MIKTLGYAAQNAKSPISPYAFERRAVGPKDVWIEIQYCGVCHSDIHQARNEWGGSKYPMVPGHEIVGVVKEVGSQVRKFKAGDAAGVGCMVDSCRSCGSCREGLEQYCESGSTYTYNSWEKDGKTPTQGGYSTQIVVDEDFVVKISSKLDLAAAAPLLCAGITTYSPLKHWNVKKGQKVGIIGLGGLGHMGVKFSRAFGADTVVFTTSKSKVEDARRLGAHSVVLSSDPIAMAAQVGKYDFILDTVAAPHDVSPYLSFLKRDGAMVLVGIPDKPFEVSAFSLLAGRKRLSGSGIGGIKETQEMLDFCAEHNIVSDIEMLQIQDINQAYDRMLKGDVKYRFVIDTKKSQWK